MGKLLEVQCCDMRKHPPTAGDTVDAIITDPPYSPKVHKLARANAQAGVKKGVRQRDLGFAHLSRSCFGTLLDWTDQCKGWQLIYSDMQGTGAIEREMGPRHVRSLLNIDGDPDVPEGVNLGYPLADNLPWIRWSMPQLNGKCPPSACEMIVIGRGFDPMIYHGPGNLLQLHHSCLRGKDKHTTEKPLDQALDLVAWFTEPGQLVFDPFAGRGTFGVACALLGREYIGFELQEDETQKANARIADALAGKFSKRDQERIERWQASVSGSVAEVRDRGLVKGQCPPKPSKPSKPASQPASSKAPPKSGVRATSAAKTSQAPKSKKAGKKKR